MGTKPRFPRRLIIDAIGMYLAGRKLSYIEHVTGIASGTFRHHLRKCKSHFLMHQHQTVKRKPRCPQN